MPAELWYYATLPRESDIETLYTREQYEGLRSYEPMMYRLTYEEYVTKFNKYQENQAKADYVLRAVAVARDTVDKTADEVEALEDFSGWVVK